MTTPRTTQELDARTHTSAWLSSAEKFALAGAALLVALQAIAPMQTLFEYRSATALEQPWRLLCAHLVHLNWPHVLINSAAWLAVARLFAPELSARRQILVLAVAAVAIGVTLRWVLPTISGYRGFSGVLHALFFAGAANWWVIALSQRGTRTFSTLWLPTALVVGGWVKVVLEQPWDTTTPYAEWLGAGVVPQAHGVGALVGMMFGLVFAHRDRLRRTKTRTPG